MVARPSQGDHHLQSPPSKLLLNPGRQGRSPTLLRKSTGKHNLEEGDQLVILNALDVMYKNQQSILDIFSVDTDVFALLTAHFSLIPQSTTLIRRGGEQIRIQESYMKLGRKRAEALLGWYAFTGTDSTGSFADKRVACHFKAFLQADDEMLDAFATFRLLSSIPPWIHRQMEKYVCLLYNIGNISSDEVPELRWMLFAQKSKECQQLPPILGTLVSHTSRAYFMVLVWRSSTEPCPLVLPTTDYFWELVDGSLKPVFCTESPAPEALLELRKCNCETDCQRNSCSCKKNNLKCTDMC